MTPSRSQQSVFPNEPRRGSVSHSFQSVSTRKILLFWQLKRRFLWAWESATPPPPCQSRQVRGCKYVFADKWLPRTSGFVASFSRRTESTLQTSSKAKDRCVRFHEERSRNAFSYTRAHGSMAFPGFSKTNFHNYLERACFSSVDWTSGELDERVT